jgi:general secretion pathway protein H
LRPAGPRRAPHRQRSGERHGAAKAGFTLFEVLFALMLMALLAGLALPAPHRPVGPMTLRMAAYGVLALLREARSAAAMNGQPTEAMVDRGGGEVDANGRRVLLPDGVAVTLADRSGNTIRFAPDGTSSGGTVVLRTVSDRAAIAVEGGTGAIHLAP